MADEYITAGQKRPLQIRAAACRGCTAMQRKRFLEVLASSSNVSLAARSAGVHAATLYSLRARDPAFAALWEEAIAMGYDRLEQALLERARLGVNDIEIDGDMPLVVNDTARGGVAGVPQFAEGRVVEGRVEMDMKLVQWLLDRRDRTVRGDGRRGGRYPAPTRDAIEAKILKKVEALKKQGRFDR